MSPTAFQLLVEIDGLIAASRKRRAEERAKRDRERFSQVDPNKVFCLGGPLHHQWYACRPGMDRLEVAVPDYHRLEEQHYRAANELGMRPPVFPSFERRTYTIDRFCERFAGGVYKEVRIATWEGGHNRLPQDDYVIRDALRRSPFRCMSEPDFIRHFGSWIRWAYYRATGDERYIIKELRSHDPYDSRRRF